MEENHDINYQHENVKLWIQPILPFNKRFPMWLA